MDQKSFTNHSDTFFDDEQILILVAKLVFNYSVAFIRVVSWYSDDCTCNILVTGAKSHFYLYFR
jgi:hypothetical protein